MKIIYFDNNATTHDEARIAKLRDRLREPDRQHCAAYLLDGYQRARSR